MEFEFSQQGDVGVVAIVGRLDASNAGALKTSFNGRLKDVLKFVFNLEGLDAIDSTGLGAIVACLKYASEAGGDIKIALLPPKPRMVFEITRAHRIFDIYDDLAAAIESYQA